MEFITHIRKPFTVNAVEITEDNISEIADIIGTLQTDAEGKPFILINRKVVPNMTRAQLGWFFTKKDDNYRCYSPTIFNAQFIAHEPGTGYFFDEEKQEHSLGVFANQFVEGSGDHTHGIKPVVSNVFDDAKLESVSITTNEGFPGSSVTLITEPPVEYRKD